MTELSNALAASPHAVVQANRPSLVQTLFTDLGALWRARKLLGVLVDRELDARHAGTAAGVLWPYIQPLLVVAAYYLVLDVVFAMRLGPEAPVKGVGVFLIIGSLPWMAFCDGLSRGANSLLEAGSVLQKNALPMVLFPVRSVLASGLIYGPLMLVVASFYGSFHQFEPSLFALIPLMLVQTLVTIVLAYLLAIFAAALRDTLQFLGFFLSVGIYLSPVLFPLALFPPDWRWALWINPITPFVLAYQDILLQGEWPQWQHWGAMACWLVGGLVLLLPVLRHSRDQLVDWL
jgi:lipopolysaccharide transport system permease protein